MLSRSPTWGGVPPGIHKADGWIACGHVDLPRLGLTLVASVHSPAYPVEPARLAGIDVTGMKLKKNPDLWFTDILFHSLRAQLGQRLLVGGDFNASRLLDQTLGERGNNEFFNRIANEGFVSIPETPLAVEGLSGRVPAIQAISDCRLQPSGESRHPASAPASERSRRPVAAQALIGRQAGTLR